MSYSYSSSESQSFTITHAKKIAAKVATDLKRMQRFYNEPSDSRIEEYEEEITQFLKAGYLDKVSYGFKKNGNWIEHLYIIKLKTLVGLPQLMTTQDVLDQEPIFLEQVSTLSLCIMINGGS